jgi:hypothetical protein
VKKIKAHPSHKLVLFERRADIPVCENCGVFLDDEMIGLSAKRWGKKAPALLPCKYAPRKKK